MACIISISDEEDIEPPQSPKRKRARSKPKPYENGAELKTPALLRQNSLERAKKSAEVRRRMMESGACGAGSIQPEDIFAPTDIRLWQNESDDEKAEPDELAIMEKPGVVGSSSLSTLPEDIDPNLAATLQRAQAQVKMHATFSVQDEIGSDSEEVPVLEHDDVDNSSLTIQIRCTEKQAPIRVKLFRNETFTTVQDNLSNKLGLSGRLVFDGQVVSPTSTPESLGLEEDDVLDLRT